MNFFHFSDEKWQTMAADHEILSHVTINNKQEYLINKGNSHCNVPGLIPTMEQYEVLRLNLLNDRAIKSFLNL